MHRPAEKEKRLLTVLLKNSELSTQWQACTVSADQRRSVCGWKQVRPSAAYIVPQTPFATRRKKIVHEEQTHVSFNTVFKPVECPYMSGYLDEDFSYMHREGLSCDFGEERMPHKHFPTQTKTTIELEPATQYRHADPTTQMDISRIVSMQLKPEILVEQLLIENRLRTMSLNAIPPLNLEGVGVSTEQKSDSAPLLRKSSHQSQATKKRKRKNPGPLEWCNFNSGPDKSPDLGRLREEQLRERLKRLQASPNGDASFNNFSYSQQGRANVGLEYRHSLNTKFTSQLQEVPSVANGTTKQAQSSAQQSVHVVEPILPERTVTTNGSKHHRGKLLESQQPPNTLTSLLKLWKNTPVRF